MTYLKAGSIILTAIILAATLVGCAAKEDGNVDIKKYFTKYDTEYFDADGFLFEIQNCDSRVEELGLGHSATEYNSASGQERQARAEEWGYSLTHLGGIVDGMGREIVTTFDNLTDRQDAVEKIFLFLENQYKSKSLSGVYYSMNGHYPWHHYAGENGFDFLGSEIGENINNYQWHIALNRGAAKQYGKKWFVDFSMWHTGYFPDVTSLTAESAIPTGGHSMSLFERSMVMSYMSGAAGLVAEGGDRLCFYSDGELSEYGKTCKKLNSFFSRTPDIGNTYVPFAIALDYYHGTYFGVGEKLAFNTFPYNKGDMMTDELINYIWDGGIEIGNDETGSLVNNGKGDLYDVLLQNASPQVLAMYPCVILSGDISFSAQETENYYQYVKNGGTLLVNTAYTDDLTEFANYSKNEFTSYGSGRVLVYGKDYSIKRLKAVLKQLTAEYVPFEFNKDVEYIVNYNTEENTLYLTLINNDGVTKLCNEYAEINMNKRVNLKVDYCGTDKLLSAEDIYSGNSVSIQGNRMKLTLAPGAIAVLKLEFEL